MCYQLDASGRWLANNWTSMQHPLWRHITLAIVLKKHELMCFKTISVVSLNIMIYKVIIASSDGYIMYWFFYFSHFARYCIFSYIRLYFTLLVYQILSWHLLTFLELKIWKVSVINTYKEEMSCGQIQKIVDYLFYLL